MIALIRNSNARARVAVIVARLCRDGATMAELRDALNQRRAMRDSAKYSLWFMRNEERLRETFNLRWARRELETFTGDLTRDFNDFVSRQYRLDFPL